jgi:CPA2 family monovalent cation:H+ antiporter-2
MHHPELILTLTGALSAALALGYLTHRVGLSPIVGYLLAGIVVGEYTPGFKADREMAKQLSEVGVILLMFGVGLHFHIEELLAVRRIAVPGAVAQSLVATGLGALAAWAFGWGWAAGAVYGLALSVASTVVLTRVLSDHNELHTPTGHIAVGWLVVEDLFTVVVLVMLPAVFGGGGGLGAALGLAVLKIGLLVAVALPVGGRVIPWLLSKVADTGSRELFTLTVLVVALGIAVGSSMLFGVSVELGAFLAGLIVARSDFSLRAANDALPMRDAFAVLFFVSVGMMFDPAYLLAAPAVVLATLAVVMLGKPLAAILIVRLFGYPVRVALSVAVALGQIGEFSFILASLGAALAVLPPEAMNALVAAAIVSISTNALLYRAVGPVERWARGRPRLWKWLNARVSKPAEATPGVPNPEADPRYRAVVVGYGPVGQTLARLLRENGVEPTIIEMNLDTVRRLRGEGIRAVYGDATHPDTLKEAGVAAAASLILTSSGLKGAEEVVRAARELNPDVRVLARSAYLRERADLYRSGADAVFAGEGEIALAMSESVLRGLGASAEQIDRERERVRAELFGELPKTASTLPPPVPAAAPETPPTSPVDPPRVEQPDGRESSPGSG